MLFKKALLAVRPVAMVFLVSGTNYCISPLLMGLTVSGTVLFATDKKNGTPSRVVDWRTFLCWVLFYD